jgi:16S rRNA (adenine1518-N6/adenine1519-N6)-dimethyltransferase
VQKEVAERFVAKEGSKDYSSFTVFIQHYAKATYAFTVEPSCFFPRPKVRSAVVHFAMKEKEFIPDMDHFLLLVRQAFSQRRKMLKASLRNFFPKQVLEKAAKSSGICLTLRPEALSRGNFLSLHLAIISESRSSLPEP